MEIPRWRRPGRGCSRSRHWRADIWAFGVVGFMPEALSSKPDTMWAGHIPRRIIAISPDGTRLVYVATLAGVAFTPEFC